MKTLEEIREEKKQKQSSLSAMKEMRDSLDNITESQERKEKRYFWEGLMGHTPEDVVKMWEEHKAEKIDLADLLEKYEKIIESEENESK